MGGEGHRGPDPRMTDKELLAIFEQSDDPSLTSTEVTEEVSIGC